MKKWLSQTTMRCATLILSLILSVWNFLDGAFIIWLAMVTRGCCMGFIHLLRQSKEVKLYD